jgi:hypothetical protein
LIKVSEQEIEHESVGANPPNEREGIVAGIVEEQLEGVNHDGNELHHLKHSQVLFPPQVLLHVRTACSEHVIEIHDDVNECVDESEKRAVSARHEFYSPPDCTGEKRERDINSFVKQPIGLISSRQCAHR